MATSTTTLSRTGAGRLPWWQSRRFQMWIHHGVVYLLLAVLSLLFIFPFFWMVTSALKPEHQIFIWPPQWLPDPIRWENFREALGNPLLPFDRFFINTMILEVGMISGRLLSCVLVAYGFARLQAPGKDFLFTVLLASLMLPSAVILIPRFILFSELGWINTYLPLIVPAWFGEAYAIFLMRQFFMTIPRELEEAALIDGANTLQIIGRIIVPLSLPVLAVITILSFKDIWNMFMDPLLYLNESTKYTIAVGLAYFNGQFNVQMNLLMAASVVTVLPVILVFFVAQRAFVEGIAMTGLKG
ncbi:carbohydrate ABC transporter permease [Litorilinea aerophila]|uniref:Carbohydrate ABC transporter permease n=1 Tax=Litorilinea aerophila TaxID=1204385 RepID=A0A540VCM3_9CHLR|nr:carbohydrate ABC transporter permease [Litorilinea aerophila]MCC9077728.1 carbohydrate ABC transporter permease [Litorilinea aerophila]